MTVHSINTKENPTLHTFPLATCIYTYIYIYTLKSSCCIYDISVTQKEHTHTYIYIYSTYMIQFLYYLWISQQTVSKGSWLPSSPCDSPKCSSWAPWRPFSDGLCPMTSGMTSGDLRIKWPNKKYKTGSDRTPAFCFCFFCDFFGLSVSGSHKTIEPWQTKGTGCVPARFMDYILPVNSLTLSGI